MDNWTKALIAPSLYLTFDNIGNDSCAVINGTTNANGIVSIVVHS